MRTAIACPKHGAYDGGTFTSCPACFRAAERKRVIDETERMIQEHGLESTVRVNERGMLVPFHKNDCF